MLHCVVRRVVTAVPKDRTGSIFRVKQSTAIFVGMFDSGEEGFTVFRKWGDYLMYQLTRLDIAAH